MLDKLAAFLVKRRYILLVLFLILAGASLFASRYVGKNGEMKKYLPDGSMTRTGLAIMNEEFGSEETAGVLQIMFREASAEKEKNLRAALSDLPGMASLSVDRARDAEGRDCLLFTMTATDLAASHEAGELYDAALKALDGEDYEIAGSVYYKRIPILPSYVMLLAVGIVSAVLVVMSDSYLAPPLFLVSILSAIALNLGTNLVFGEISVITDAISAILQLALSMDYSIMLMARYRAERAATDDKVEAMRRAVRGSFAPVTGSAQTTFAGLLTLVFMGFTIGRDLGFVLAKGVLCSLLTVFCMLPALITLFDRLLVRTAKKSPELRPDRLAGFVYRARLPLTVVFVLLFIFGAVFQGGQKISFTGSELDHVSEVFGRDNDFVLIYPKEMETEILPYLQRIEEDDDTKLLLSRSTFDRTLSPAGLSSLLDRVGVDLPVGEDLLQMICYMENGGSENEKLTVAGFIAFLGEEAHGGAFDLLGETSSGGVPSAFATPELISRALTADDAPRSSAEMAEYFEGTPLNGDLVKAGYTLYAALHTESVPGISLRALGGYLTDGFLKTPFIARLLPEKTAQTLAALDLSKAEERFVGAAHARAMVRTALPLEGEATFDYIDRMLEIIKPIEEKGVYLISDSTFAYEMNNAFMKEYALISVLTMAAVFLIVALTFRSLAIPTILVAVIECAVFVTMALMRISGMTVYFLAIIVLQSILMGATVDYAILFTSYFREYSRGADKKEALRLAYRSSIGTILTSSVILTVGTLIVGWTAIEIVSKICLAIAWGTICATLLILLFTPAMLALFTREKKEKKNGADQRTSA